MSAHEARWHTVARADEVGESWPHPVDVDGVSIALYRVGGDVYATAGICTHMEQPLADGYFDAAAGTIECPLHQARFLVSSGAALCPPAHRDLRTYPVRVVAGEVQVDLGEPEEARR